MENLQRWCTRICGGRERNARRYSAVMGHVVTGVCFSSFNDERRVEQERDARRSVMKNA